MYVLLDCPDGATLAFQELEGYRVVVTPEPRPGCGIGLGSKDQIFNTAFAILADYRSRSGRRLKPMALAPQFAKRFLPGIGHNAVAVGTGDIQAWLAGAA